MDAARKLAVVSSLPGRTESRSDRFEGLVACALAAIVACYALAVVIRVIMAYGT